jgi:hypothetical protein
MFERTSRRRFLQRSAAMAAAGGLVRSVFVNTSARAAAANDRIGVGGIGMGFMGSTIAHGAAALGAMVACADVNLQQAERFANDYQGCQPYQDYRRILDRNDVHVVTIGTPDHWHAKIAIDANIDVSAGMQPTGWWSIINRAHMTNFFECVRERKEPVSDVFSHHRAVSTCHLANIAMLLKRKLRWDPEKEDFVGDETASNLVARPRRNPYNIEA